MAEGFVYLEGASSHGAKAKARQDRGDQLAAVHFTFLTFTYTSYICILPHDLMRKCAWLPSQTGSTSPAVFAMTESMIGNKPGKNNRMRRETMR